jgi:peptidoglycan/xylan/chitin deacetylase (PgdA/CDA1 family)
MRVVVIVVAALMTLGLAAFGIVAAQKATNAPLAITRATAPAVPAPAVVAHEPATSAPLRTLADVTESPIVAAPVVPTQPAPVRVAQNTADATPTPPPPPSPAKANTAACDKPGGMGLSRVVEIDTTGGPGFGFEHFKQYDFLRDHEVVLTFDDGPWPENTPAVLKALADNCLKATFFEIGEHAMWHPEIAKQVAAAGNTIGSHTWSHKDLARNPYASDLEQAKLEIEMGLSAVHMAVAGPIAPFFRFPDLQHPPQLLSYLAERNIATFSTDIDSFDFKIHKPDLVIKSVMSKLEKHGKGIVLMHDFQRGTAEAMPELLRQLKAGGYKVVHVVAREPAKALPKYDDMIAQQDKLSVNNSRPVSSVVRTIGE